MPDVFDLAIEVHKELACEQALRGALASNLNICIEKRCEMLIGGDDISNAVITLGTCFSMFVYI